MAQTIGASRSVQTELSSVGHRVAANLGTRAGIHRIVRGVATHLT